MKVQPDALYIDAGQIITAAGSAAGLDMLLHLVRRDYGGAVANKVAQRLVISPHREGGQAQFIPRPMLTAESDRLSKLMAWVRANPALPHTLHTLAEHAATSPRTLQRQFLNATGFSPYEWVIRERVALVRALLETQTGLAVEQIAERVGFGSIESMRRHFRRVTLTSPAAYRRKFSAPALSHKIQIDERPSHSRT